LTRSPTAIATPLPLASRFVRVTVTAGARSGRIWTTLPHARPSSWNGRTLTTTPDTGEYTVVPAGAPISTEPVSGPLPLSST